MRGSRPKTWDVVVLGGINTDYVIQAESLPEPGETVPGQTFFIGPGGKGANQAVAAARLGAKVGLIGRVGDEPRGRELAQGLRRDGVDVRHVNFDSRTPSGAAIIGVGGDGEKQILAALGANLKVPLAQIDRAGSMIASAKVLLMQFEAPQNCVLRAAWIARRHGTRVILDPAPPPDKFPASLFPLLDIIRPNCAEAEQITGMRIKSRSSARKAGRWFLERGVRVAALQAGDEGDLIVSCDEEIFLPRLKVTAVDATGAGDAFAGAMAAALAEGLPLRDLGRLANAVAALATTKAGAQNALPNRTEVERFLKKHRA